MHERRHIAALGVVVVIPLVLASSQAFAFRPYKSTDAAVVDARELEIELGVLTIERNEGETGFITPSLVLNYGLTDIVEFVGEFELENPADGGWEFADPGVFLKAVLKQGALQGAPGLSIATEFGALLPSSKDDENAVGGEAILIASGRLAAWTYHINLGGGVDRAENAFWAWGVIGEVPVSKTLTLGGELTGEDAASTASDCSALIGARFQPEGWHTVFDMGVRRGLTPASPDWTLTAGLTTSF